MIKINNYLFTQILNQEEKIFIKKINDLCQKATKGFLTVSDFLDLRQQELARIIVEQIIGIQYSFDGGFLESERKRLIVLPDWETTFDNNILCLRITPNVKDCNLEHRDYLGSILSMGIKREKIGDIKIQGKSAFVFIDASLADFLIFNLNKVRKYTVKVELFNIKDFFYIEEDKKIISTTVPSLRIDAIISAAFNISRSDAVSFIQSENVKVNHKIITKSSYSVNEGSLISVRGKGRFKIEEIGELTRKNRYRINISF